MYKKADKKLKELDERSQEYKQIIKDLGKKALEENSKWVVFHDKMRAKPSIE